MRIIEQPIKDLYIIEPISFNDFRGKLIKEFNFKEINKFYKFDVRMCYTSVNLKKGTLRGFHYQVKSSKEAKIISVSVGKILNIVLDLRPKSKTFLRFLKFNLDNINQKKLLVPKGCANLFITQKNNTIVNYLSSNYYSEKNQRGIKYNDKYFNFHKFLEPIIISEKDKKWDNFNLKKHLKDF